METIDQRHDATPLRDYLRVLRRRKWIVLLPTLLVPLIALFFSFRQERLYQASADVFLANQNLASTISGITPTYQDPARYVQTQVDLARVPTVAERVLSATHLQNRSAGDLLQRSVVSAQDSADLLTFQVTDHDPALAVRLATEYARQFKAYRRELDTASLTRARRQVGRQLTQFGTPPSRRSPLYETYANLVQRQEQLRTLEALQSSNAVLVREAGNAVQIQPRPKRNAALGVGLGLIFGIGLALLWHSLDTRIRAADDIRERLRIPLLARIPEPSRRFRRGNQVAMLAEPHSLEAEAFRMLRTNLEFVKLERQSRTIMFTSAVEKEGKSTTVVNLAVAFARSGHRVALVDLDLRRPVLARVFELGDHPGITDVARGKVSLDQALASVAIGPRGGAAPGAGGNGSRGELSGILEVLSAGAIPPDPGEFVAGVAVSKILESLASRAELVLIDAPPLLHVGDAMTLSAKVDAMVVVTRLNVVRRQMLVEVRRLLDGSPAAALGFVVTGADLEEGYGYPGYYDYRPVTEKRQEPVA